MKKLLLLSFVILSSSLLTLKAQRPPCTFNITVAQYQPVSCFGDCNGSYIATAHSGTPPYRWNGGPLTHNTADTVTGLCAGNYTVVAVDSNFCTATASVTITQPSQLTLSIINVVAPTCGSCPDGSATGSATGGTSPYSYIWTPGGATSATATGLTAGTYQCCVTDSHGCVRCDTLYLSPAGVNNLYSQGLDFTVSPNPSNGKFIVQLSAVTCQKSVEVYNMLGEKVYSRQIAAGNTSYSIDISGLGKGVYIFTIKTVTQTGLKKVVIY